MSKESDGRRDLPNIVEIRNFKIFEVSHYVVADLKEKKVFVVINHPFLLMYFNSKEGGYWVKEGEGIFGADIKLYTKEFIKYMRDTTNTPKVDKTVEEVEQEALSLARDIRSSNLS